MEYLELKIGIFTWWQYTATKREIVVINFSGFEKVTLVEVLEKYTRDSKRIAIEKFLKAVEDGKLTRVGEYYPR